MFVVFILSAIFLFLFVLWSLDWMLMLITLLKIVAIMVPLLVFVLYLILAERKIMGYMQARVGPNRVGPLGVFQTVADGLKFLLKEIIIPADADKVLFLAAPLLSLVPAFSVWSVIPYDQGWVLADIHAGVLFLFAMTSMGIYGVILAGWASNSQYAFFGGIRAMAQMISYEIVMGFALIGVLMLAGSMNLSDIVRAQSGGFWHWYVWPLMPIFVVYWISSLAEINRAPFDVVEGESEIVAGYQVEYSGFAFAMFFIAEYCNMILMACVSALFFWGGWHSPFEGVVYVDRITAWVPGIAWLLLKTCLLLYLMIWLRSTLPRYRYDQVMMLVWKTLIPVTVFWLFVVALFIQGGWL